MRERQTLILLFLSLYLASPGHAEDWGHALKFDGDDDFARVLNFTAAPTGNASYTQEVWVKINDWHVYYNGVDFFDGFIFSRGGEGVGRGNHILPFANVGHTIGLTHWIPDRDTGFPVELGIWYHIATTWDGTTETLYVNGVRGWWEDWGSGFVVDGGSLTFGKHDNFTDFWFEGEIDEVRVWNLVRSESEIMNSYMQRVDPASSGLVGYWSFDEGSGQTISDSTSHGQHGQLGDTSGVDVSDPLWVVSTVELLYIKTTTLERGVVGDAVLDQFEPGNGVPPYSWSVIDGTLPPGLHMSIDGALSGVPLIDGDFTFTVRLLDGEGSTAEEVFTKQILLTQPGAELRIYKWGTTPVPGRLLEYFILVQNVGLVDSEEQTVVEYLEPWFTFDSASPDPQDVSEDGLFVYWLIPPLPPSSGTIITYKAQLDPNMPVGEEVRGCACLTVDEALSCGIAVAACGGGAALVCPPPATLLKCLGACTLGYLGCMIDKGRDCSCDPRETDQPVDPNEKGALARTFIQPDQRLVYPIHFENIGEIEALDVFVTDVLDLDLDESTLEFLTPGGTYDPATRTVSWDLLGINLQPGETGHVLFAVKPLPGLPAGTQIENIAEIQFEVFDIIPTNEGVPVVNIIDDTLPECVVNTLPAVSTTTLLELSWTFIDQVGEPAVFDLSVAVDGGPFEHAERTLEASLTFQAEEGRSYEFLCTVEDTAGNKEIQIPIEAEAGPITIGGIGLPPGVPSGPSGQAMTVDKLTSDGSTLSVSWDTTTCTDSVDHNLVFGGGSQLPTELGGTYLFNGSVCSIGDISPYTWNSSPDATLDPTGFMWWLVVATDGSTTEGSSGQDSNATERSGPGPGSSSGECGILDKNLSNTCEQ